MATLNIRPVPQTASLPEYAAGIDGSNRITRTLTASERSRIARREAERAPAGVPVDTGTTPSIDVLRACDEFLEGWRFEADPKIEDYLSWVPDADRLKLFQRLLRIELSKLKERGIAPMVEQYLCRFPHYARAIREAWRGAFTEVLPARERAGGRDSATATVIKSVRIDVIEGPHNGESYQFTPGTTVVLGRSRSVNLRLPADYKISRRHLQLAISPYDIRMIDLASRNGTLLNARKAFSAEMADGDLLFAGRSRLRIKIEREASAS